MSVLKIDPLTNDLAREGGSFVRISGGAEIVQGVNTRLRLFVGEAFLRTDLGTDWIGVFFSKGPRQERMRQEIRDVILGSPGVVEVTRIDFVTFDPAARTLTIDWSGVGELTDLARRIPIHDRITPSFGEAQQ